MPGFEGYKAARDILKRNFGQRHVIIRSLIDKVVKGPQLKSSDGEKLSQLARDMRICQLNSSELRYQADINSIDTLTKIVMRLPVHMLAKWAEESGKLLEMSLEPSFLDLTEFIEKRALVANTEFGKLVGSKQSEPRLKRTPWRVADGKGTVLAFSKVGGNLQDVRNTNSLKGKYPVESRTICKFCDGTHELEKCFKFRDKRYAQRKEFIRKQPVRKLFEAQS